MSDTDPAWLHTQIRHLLDFARGSLLPDGTFGLLDDTGAVTSARAELYVTCRMTHVFCIGDALGEVGSRDYAAAGVAALTSRFADRLHGGWWHAVDADGTAESQKNAYDHAFVVLAAASAVARGIPGGQALLEEALATIELRFWEEDQGLLRESFTADWEVEEDYRGVNANMHAVEAFLAAYDATGEVRWRDRAARIVDRVIDGWARHNGWRIPEHFDRSWHPDLDYNQDAPADPFRPYGATIGHGMEWARLCLQLWSACGSPPGNWLVEAAEQLYARARVDGWARDGADGFVYTVDWAGQPVVHERMHWVAAEAIGAAIVLHKATGLPSYDEDVVRWWAYVRAYLIDPVGGSWHHELSMTNTPSTTVWAGKPDVYHALQACVLALIPISSSITAACGQPRIRTGTL